ncbi:MAG: hypothetical protein H7281_14150 [Bacteriovorax sp.]|nr:hypothetical protein [Bacteriovorax sp.]
MLKILILIALSFNIAFASTRFTDADKKKFMDEVKQGIAAHKIENKGKVDLQIIKPGLYEELDVYYKQEKFTREEMIKIKQKYEEFSRSGIAPEKAEEEFYKFVQIQLNEINKTQVVKTKEGQVCNNWSCEDGLKCAPDPKQEDGLSCKKEGKECKDDGDCCSSSCTLNKKSKKRYCEDVYRCFKPVNLGGSCLSNPVCGEGECLAFNSKTSGIGECEERGRSCKKNTDCCTNSCEKNKCVEAYICKDCVKNGKKPNRGQKCCEGLYINDKGLCVPDAPPFVMPQVRVKFIDKTLITLTSFFITTSSADEAFDTVNADHAKYESFRAMSVAADKVEVKTPDMKFTRKSDFSTCDIRFRDDFTNYLKTSNLLDLELALLSFDYMLLGDGVNDYWTKNTDPGSSIYGRLKVVAKKHQQIRSDTNDKIDKINAKLTCMCLDVKGYKSITDASKKTFFEKSCDEYAKYSNPTTTFDELQGDASGLKGKRLMVNWTKNLESFNASLAVDNTGIYKGFAEISNWSAYEAKWNDADNKKYTLFNFNIKNPSGSVAAMGAILGALLAAGVIAVLGGFATTSMLTAWAAAGIIATSAITGGTGLWLIASLKGAWISKRPEIFDKYIRSYGCGKKETCVEYSRELNQPYNEICKAHTSANACVKNFMVYYQENEPRYLVDPWIPTGVSKNLILRDAGESRDYAQKLEDGFQTALTHMKSKDPGASGGGGKDGGAFVGEDYMRSLFVDSDVLGKYTPNIGLDDQRYILNANIIQEIKTKAKKFAVDQKFFEATDVENLDKFADYSYTYHFLWPKTSRQKEISYPTVGLTTYLDLMSNGVAANMAVGATNAAKTFGNLNTKYLEDYLKTLQLYADQPINQSDATKTKLLNDEITKAQAALDNQRVLSALANNTSLDSQLMNLNPNLVNTTAKSLGTKGDVSLSADQSAFLNAIGTLRTDRKAQLKKMDVYNKAIASSGNTDRATKIASASKKFSATFAHPLSGSSSKGTGSIFGSGGADGLKSDDANKADSSKNSSKSGNFNNFGLGSISGSGSGSSGSSTSLGSSKSGVDDKNASATGGAGNGVSDEDRRRLAEAIDARNKANKDKYESKEEQTIFEKVTNAYIRNYDKVLSKKKDKDVIEQK